MTPFGFALLLSAMLSPSGTLPPALESYLAAAVRPSAAERKLLQDGRPMTKLLDADPTRVVAVFGAVWIDAPMQRYVEAVKDIENFERGRGFRVTRRISTPPRIEDFADYHLSKDDVSALRSCRVGDCELKLGEDALKTLRTEVDWKAASAEAAAENVMRRLALEYVTGYLEGGNERLAVYRDKSRPTSVAAEFRSIVDEMPALTSSMPELRRYLLGFPDPDAAIPGSTSFLYWQETQFGLKPTIRISHVVIREGAEETVLASKMLYASHYFWTALEVRVLVPDPSRGPGFWLVTVSRSRCDGLSGFVGRIARGRVRRAAQQGTAAVLAATKRRLEQGG
jgi:hypothetical protein